MLLTAAICGILARVEVPHASKQPLSHRTDSRRSSRADPSRQQVYVTVLSGRPSQDDLAGGRGLQQPRDRDEPAHATRDREPVAQTLLRPTIAGAGRSDSPGPTPGFPPQRWSSRSRRWPVSGRPRWGRRFRASAWPMWRTKRASSGWSPPSATARSGAGSTPTRFVPGSIVAGSFPRSAIRPQGWTHPRSLRTTVAGAEAAPRRVRAVHR